MLLPEDSWSNGFAPEVGKHVEIPPPVRWRQDTPKPALHASRTTTDPKLRVMCEELCAGYETYKREHRQFAMLRRIREARRALRVEMLERSVRGDLEKVVRNMLRADWTHLSSEEVLEKMDYLRGKASAFHVLKTRYRKRVAAIRQSVRDNRLGASFWKLTAHRWVCRWGCANRSSRCVRSCEE